jgi:hypothetical protein
MLPSYVKIKTRWFGVKYLTAISLILSLVVPAAALSPFVHGGLDDVRAGSWTFVTEQPEELVPVYYGSTLYVGGGFTYDIAKFRQKRIVPTLSLDTDGGFTYFRRDWRAKNLPLLESREQKFYQLTAVETLVLRVKVPAGSRLITPFVGVGGGVAVIPSSVGRLEEYVRPGEEGYYEDETTSFNAVYSVPFGLEITMSPSSTIYWRFGPLAPVGDVTYDYQTAPNRRERVDASVPNSFLVIFGYRWGQ